MLEVPFREGKPDCIMVSATETYETDLRTDFLQSELASYQDVIRRLANGIRTNKK
jgi:hypothetical protein